MFIKVTANNGTFYTVQISHIVYVISASNGTSVIRTITKEWLSVKESEAEIMTLIRNIVNL